MSHKTDRTVYDWVRGKEGIVLEPRGGTSILMTVVVGCLPHDTLRVLYDKDMLYGRALEEAKRRYGTEEEKDDES